MKAWAGLALLLASCGPASGVRPPATVEAPYTPDSGTLLVRCGRFIDGLSDDVRSGVEPTIKIPKMRACETCSGSGAAPGTRPESCQHCGGQGQMVFQQGFFRVNRVCEICNGSGEIIREPTSSDLRSYRARRREQAREFEQRSRLRRMPTRTLDGADVRLLGNAESREDVAEAHALGATGIGLYRTEFLFLRGPQLPDEDEQFLLYRDLVLGMIGRPVTIRTLDLGADKADRSGLALSSEPNPALGLRGVRLSLSRRDLFVTQLRAILRASAYGPVRVLVPMVSRREEMLAVRALLHRCHADLLGEGMDLPECPPLGAMIEVPAAALALHSLASTVDFVSVGTNDLVQYVLAADRGNDALGDLYSPMHPAIIHLLHQIIATGRKYKIPVAMCGEIAGDPLFTPLLLALGLEEFSLHPATLLEVREKVRACHLGNLRRRTSSLLRATDRDTLERWLRRSSPD